MGVVALTASVLPSGLSAKTEGLRAVNLTGSRGSERLFQGLSFSVKPGELVWLRGQNGSGKTTLLRLVTGLTSPEVGEITWNGVTLRKSEVFHDDLVYLGHHNGLKDDLTALESLRFLCQLHGRDATPAQTDAALKRMEIFHRRNLPARVLSQGQRKRVALARLALEARPGLWVLDEPFDALDDGGVATVNGLLQEHLQRGGSALLTSHISLTIDAGPVRELTLVKPRSK